MKRYYFAISTANFRGMALPAAFLGYGELSMQKLSSYL
jgi:hypothetical protein